MIDFRLENPNPWIDIKKPCTILVKAAQNLTTEGLCGFYYANFEKNLTISLSRGMLITQGQLKLTARRYSAYEDVYIRLPNACRIEM